MDLKLSEVNACFSVYLGWLTKCAVLVLERISKTYGVEPLQSDRYPLERKACFAWVVGRGSDTVVTFSDEISPG